MVDIFTAVCKVHAYIKIDYRYVSIPGNTQNVSLPVLAVNKRGEWRRGVPLRIGAAILGRTCYWLHCWLPDRNLLAEHSTLGLRSQEVDGSGLGSTQEIHQSRSRCHKDGLFLMLNRAVLFSEHEEKMAHGRRMSGAPQEVMSADWRPG